MKILAAHLVNDFSGSPKVLMQLLKGWVQNDIQVSLYTSNNREGFLSKLQSINYTFFKYNYSGNFVSRILSFGISQISLFIKILKDADKTDVVYVNTVLPFGAALAGKAKGCRVIYHIHETSVSPLFLKKLVFKTVQWTATDVIYVSHYLANKEPIQNKRIYILHNAIENEFMATAQKYTRTPRELRNILMVCSLREYKGVFEFIDLADIMPKYKFKLVLNATEEEITTFFEDIIIPLNVTVIDSQTNLHPYYQWADLTLNLSLPDQWIETFGLTILEGLAYGNPAIVPTVGGVVELIEDNKNGYRIDSKNTADIAATIRNLNEQRSLFQALRSHALSVVDLFKEDYFITKNIQILTTK